MRTYVLVSFILGATVFIIDSLVIGCTSYPKTKTVTLQQEVAAKMLHIGFIIWAGILLFS